MSATIYESDSAASAKIYAAWVGKLGREYSALKRWALRTVGPGCLPWPTAKAISGGANSQREARGAGGPDLQEAAEQWSTPNCPDGGRSVSAETVARRGTTAKGKVQVGLESEVRHWQSPQGRDFRSGIITPETAAKHLGSRPLNEEVLNWPSPNANPAGPNMSTMRENGRVANRITEQCLERAAQNWPTSRAEDSESCGNHPGAIDSLRGAVENWQDPSTSLPTEPATGTAGPTCWCGLPGCVLRSHKRRLTPYFDEWLQGWPINWSSATKELIGFDQWVRESRLSLWHLLSEYSQRRTVSGVGGTNQPSLF
jgi:hypothetical protein